MHLYHVQVFTFTDKLGTMWADYQNWGIREKLPTFSENNSWSRISYLYIVFCLEKKDKIPLNPPCWHNVFPVLFFLCIYVKFYTIKTVGGEGGEERGEKEWEWDGEGEE